MLLTSYKENFIEKAMQITDREEAQQWFFMTIEYVMNISKIHFLTREYTLNEQELEKLEAILGKLVQYQPIQYIFGKADFYGYEFLVNEHTLIPRRETEELVEWILETISEDKNNERIELLDIGTGSGCIPVSLSLQNTRIKASAIDISLEALLIADKNARKLGASVQYMQADILQTEVIPKVDIIVSNPPYVRDLEKAEIQANVLDYEPHTALFVPDHDPLLFYKKITELAEYYLDKGGYLFFEINQYLADEMVEMMQFHTFSKIEIKKDMQGNYRMLRAIKV